MLLTRPLSPDLDLLDLHRLAPRRYPVLLESSAHGTPHGRWDMLLATDGTRLQLDADGVTRDGAGVAQDGDFLEALDSAWQAERTPRDEPRWPFRGGWALLLGYEMARQVEPVLTLPDATGGLPVALALRCPAAILRDHVTGEGQLLDEQGRAGMLDTLEADAANARGQPPLPPWTPPATLEEDPPERYIQGVRSILDYLAAGDVFQANLSRAWR